LNTTSFTDGIVKSYVGLRKNIKKQSVIDANPFSFKLKIAKRVISMVVLTLILNWATPHLMVDDFLGGWSLQRFMIVTILIETLLYGYDIIWSMLMSLIHHILNIVDSVASFPPIDFPEEEEYKF
jgi:hypothetical protein